jgi:preprotein translocase subunit SecA
VRTEEDVEAVEQQRREQQVAMQYQHAEAAALTSDEEQPEQGEEAQPFVREGRKVGRNEPCPCGSGKKYKQCHGKLA